MVRVQYCTPGQFMELTKDRKIICFCAGDNFRTFCENYPVIPRIECAVDSYKAGSIFRMGDREIPVVSMEQIEDISHGTVLVLTSVKAADEIMPKLDQDSRFRDMELYVPEMFGREKTDFMLQADAVQAIPKVIHYCWFGGAPIPCRFQENIDSWRKYCPDYEIIQWNESNYDVSRNTYMRQAYESRKWGFVPDYARLDIVESQGGIYLDTDVRMVRSFDPLLQFGMFCGFESMTRINLGQGFGAVKGHPVVRKLRKGYENLEFIDPAGKMNTVPSPVYQTRELERLGVVIDGTFQQLEDAVIFPQEYFSPVNEFGYGMQTENTFSVHQYDGSWYDEKQRETKERVIRNYEYMAGRMTGRGE